MGGFISGWKDAKPYERVIVAREDGKDCDNGLLLDTLNGNKNKRASVGIRFVSFKREQ